MFWCSFYGWDWFLGRWCIIFFFDFGGVWCWLMIVIGWFEEIDGEVVGCVLLKGVGGLWLVRLGGVKVNNMFWVELFEGVGFWRMVCCLGCVFVWGDEMFDFLNDSIFCKWFCCLLIVMMLFLFRCRMVGFWDIFSYDLVVKVSNYWYL